MACFSLGLILSALLFPAIAAAQETNSTTPTKIGILLFPAFEPLDVFGPAEALQTLGRQTHLDLYLISNVNGTDLSPVSTEPRSAAMNPFNSTFWQSVVPTHTLETVPDDLEVLLVPGGLGTRAQDLQPTADFIKAVYPKLHSLISVCTGAILVGKSGVLDGRRATTNKASFNQITPQFPHVQWDRYPRWVVDGNVWSSGGVSAGTDVAFGWIASTFGEDVARDVANRVEYEWRNDPNWDPFAYVWKDSNLN
ncbi:class I glutamine amidotransferase-like protein [Fomes fomentarius]|nr:class I glutamine amidotransferase-like protein [Fomes fomentarius]